ncbi:hypothetical protein E1286_05065 [Nonomuraea terrae]|uniref:Uncharacterized protein n=1 Tax=Nonomuraea terrae TaxID=2530383 RepID=A0A4R4ZB25_9ACTN|nr:hypothetical protein E1286_05065 [Nonomuraea terrae]
MGDLRRRVGAHVLRARAGAPHGGNPRASAGGGGASAGAAGAAVRRHPQVAGQGRAPLPLRAACTSRPTK